jgi:hypothetical protein
VSFRAYTISHALLGAFKLANLQSELPRSQVWFKDQPMTVDPTLFPSLCGYRKIQAARMIDSNQKLIAFYHSHAKNTGHIATKSTKGRPNEHPDDQLCLLHRQWL